MFPGTPAPVPAGPAEPPRWVYWLTGALAAAGFLILILLAIGQNSTASTDTEPGLSGNDLRVFAAMMLSLPLVAVIFFRERAPFVVPIVGAVIVILLPGAPLISAIALASLVHRRRGWRVALTAVLVGVAQVVGVIRDQGAQLSLLRDALPGGPGGVVAAIAVGALVPMIVALGYGTLRAMDRDRRLAVSTTRNVVARSQVLYDEVARQHERTEIARELHDTVAAQLSVISLNAGALGLAGAAEEPERRDAYDRIQSAAQNAVTDLRGLIGDLRSPGQTAHAGTTESLYQLTELIDRAHAAGENVRSSILIGDLETCSPEVSHVCYRLIQESLSNARRHAPRGAVRLSLRGGPDTGLSLEVVSAVGEATPAVSGGGLGLVGMDERTARLGGWFAAGVLPSGEFRVQAWLPWSPKPVTP